ncbi:MAG: flagellar hook-associated protein FlgL [Halanaerobiales bacterium]|nr:flagellar hook-associated protein FlgL [Halanaerobiales bacterium]
MRVTNSMMVRNILGHLQNNMEDLNNLNEQLSSGKLFQKPSDSPIKVSDSLNYKSILNHNTQYQRNLGQAENWLNSTESALKSGTEVIQRARELTIYASTDSLTAEDRNKIASEVKQLRDELIDISQAKQGENYIFSGQRIDQKPFDINKTPSYTVDYQGDKRGITRQFNDGVEMKINLNGEDVFKKDIEALNDLYEELKNGGSGEDIGNYVEDMDISIDNFINLRSQIGAKLNRVRMTESRLTSEELHITKMKSENEDVDLAEVITNLKMEETVYRASLASGSRIMQQSLVDFMR